MALKLKTRKRLPNSILFDQKVLVSKPNIISNYQIKQTLGVGAYAKVKRAIHIPTGQEVAVKIISLKKINSEKRRIIDLEVMISKKLVHQNIAKIYEIYENNQKMFIFLEYCENGELFEHVDKSGPLKKKDAIKIFKQIHSAVSYLHYNNICHRDIKLQNILLDKNFNAKLIDFGLASYYYPNKTNDEQDAMLKSFCGSPSYLSPQMLSKTPYNPELLDVWCLGVTLYTLFTAQLPFYDKDLRKQKLKICSMNYVETGDNEIDKLLGSMLCCEQQRRKLQQIENDKTLKDMGGNRWNYLTIDEQKQALDHLIIQKISKKFNICRNEILQSVKEATMDSKYALYFLYLAKQRKQGYESCYDINSPNFFKKKRRNSHFQASFTKKKMNMNKQSKSISLKKRRNSVKLPELNIKKSINKNLIRNESQESPRRILANQKRYLQNNQYYNNIFTIVHQK